LVSWLFWLVFWLKDSRLGSRFRASNRGSLCVLFIIGFTGCGGGWVKTPFGEERFVNLLGLGELKGAGFLGDNSTLVLGLELGNKLGDETAGFLWVQVTDFFGNINKRNNNFVVALFGSFFECATSTANFNWKLFTRGVTNKFARLLFNILG